MNAGVTGVNLFLGLAYLGIGTMTAIDLKRGWKTMGYSHFGVAFMLLAFTCGPHHLAHALHTGLEGRPGGAMDLLTAGVGLPAGVIWLLLRIEAFTGGRGDRTIAGTPGWMTAGPPMGAAIATALVFGISDEAAGGFVFRSSIAPNLLLVVIYAMIGIITMRTQIANRRGEGFWSISGLSLSAVFLTCSLMHLAWATYAMTGRYEFDTHGFIIDWVSVPAGLYFLWAVRAISAGTLRDWTETEAEAVPATSDPLAMRAGGGMVP